MKRETEVAMAAAFNGTILTEPYLNDDFICNMVLCPVAFHIYVRL